MKNKALTKVTTMLLSIAMVVSVLTSLSVITYAETEENAELPEPVAVYDFSYDFEELAAMNEGFQVVENEAAPTLVKDDEMGQVLKLGKAVIGEREFAVVSGAESGYIISDTSQYSTINIENPYKGLYYLKEYEPWQDVKTTLYRGHVQPKWTQGITISYWIKTPAGENGYGVNSNVVGFTSNRFQMQADDLAKYLSSTIYGRDINKFTDAEKKLLDIEYAGVEPSSAFYIELAEEETYNGLPLYTDNVGELYWMNENYVEGYIQNSDGTITQSATKASNNYSIPPYLGDTKEDHDPGESIIRYAWTYSEMWLDATSSFYFENDTSNVNEQLNSNVSSYGVKMGMQNNDCFNINSWKGSTNIVEADSKGMAADSPALYPDEWHHVTCVIQNDWVKYYFDGEEIDIEAFYSSFGGTGLATVTGNYKPWKRFNKGTGSRYGYGHNKVEIYNCEFGNYVAATMMEWIVKDCVKTSIGGGNVAGDGYCMYADTDEIQLKNVVFYDKVLNEAQIEELATHPFIYDKKNETGTLGDVNADEIINAKDALSVLKHAAVIETLEGVALECADVNGDESIDAKDALDILKYAAGLIKEFSK